MGLELSSVTSPPPHSAHLKKMDGLLRNQWTAYSGIDGRLPPDSVVGIDRITQNRNPGKTRLINLQDKSLKE